MPARVCIYVYYRLLSLLVLSLAVGCATSTIQSRLAERSAAFETLPPDQQELVRQGQVRVGMSSDAVYIAWGPPAEVFESEDPSGHITTWQYHGTWMQETRYWTYREVKRGEDDIYLERYLATDYNPRDYVRAEIHFRQGKVVNWRTAPRPAY